MHDQSTPNLETSMATITVVSASHYSNTLVYMVLRGKTTYWIQCSEKLPPYVSQRYFSKLGRSGERRLPDGKVRDDLLAAIEAYKAQPLLERAPAANLSCSMPR